MTLRALAVSLLALGALPAGAAAAPAARVTFPSAAARPPAGARVLGRATDSVDVLVGLHQRDLAGLEAFIAQVSDPTSTQYGHYLAPAQFRARYAPAQASVDAVRAFAAANGLRVGDVPANHAFVELTGSAAAAERAFATELQAVRVGGRTAHLPTGTPSVPASLRGIVTTVEGLDTSRLVRPMAQTFPDAFVNAGPCSSYYGEKLAGTVPGAYGTAHFPYAPCGYVPAQLRSAYGLSDVVAHGIDGRGIKVGIIDAYDYPHAQDDANTYAGRHGELALSSYTDNSPAGLANVPEGAGFVDPNGWAGEQQLDVEAIHAIAPRAQIVYHGAASPANIAFTQTQNAVVDNAEAQIVSNSYGGAEDDSDANTENVLRQAAATGIGFFFSSGDEGDETKDPNGPGDREVDSSANQPMATGVGGTSLAVGSDGGYRFETGWGTYSATLTNGTFTAPGDFNSGGGGGTSQVYGQPSYQAGVVPDAISRFFAGQPGENSQGSDFVPLVPGRAVPDVAMDADPNTGMLIGQQQDFDATRNGTDLPGDEVKYSEYRIGGTSLASPLFAGVMALADQASGHPHGFANPALYKLAGTNAFNDVVDPASTLAVIRNDFANSLDSSGGIDTKLRTLNQTNTIHTVPGYDDVTGLGSPRGVSLLHALAPGNATLAALAAPPAQPAAAPPAPPPSPTPAPPVRCVRHRITIRLRAQRHDAIRRVVVRLAGHKRVVLRGRNVRRFRLRTPARTRKLTVTTTSRRGLRIVTVRKVGTCGQIGRAKQVSRRHLRG